MTDIVCIVVAGLLLIAAARCFRLALEFWFISDAEWHEIRRDAQRRKELAIFRRRKL